MPQVAGELSAARSASPGSRAGGNDTVVLAPSSYSKWLSANTNARPTTDITVSSADEVRKVVGVSVPR